MDIAIRYGEQPDSNLIALPLAPHNRRALVASAKYLTKQGEPTHPQELVQHTCLCFLTGEDRYDRWRFWQQDTELPVKIAASYVANDGEIVKQWAIAGMGIAYKSWLDVGSAIQSGQLVELCKDWQTEPAPLFLVCTDRRLLTPAIKLLRDYLTECCQQLAHIAQD